MSRRHINGVATPFPYLSITFDAFEVSWAGANPFQRGFCFGLDDGRLLFTDEEEEPLYNGPTEGSISSEAVNGVAACLRSWAVSTRSEVVLRTPPLRHEDKFLTTVLPVGTHGVLATESGYFVAPLGLAGLMVVKPERPSLQPVVLNNALEVGPYFYQVICLRTSSRREVLVCALRRDGVGILPFSGTATSQRLATIAFDGLDVVDVCALAPGSESLAAAALGKDGTLVLIRDALQDKVPLTLKFDGVKGTAYRVLPWRGHLCILTSDGIYMLAHLAERFVAGEAIEGMCRSLFPLPMEAVDICSYQDQWLLVVLADEVRMYDLEKMDSIISDPVAEGQIQTLSLTPLFPKWIQAGIEQTANDLVAVAG